MERFTATPRMAVATRRPRTRALHHDLTTGVANHEQLPIVHAPEYVADDGTHHLLYASQSKGGRLLHNEVRLRCLERLHIVLVHDVIGELNGCDGLRRTPPAIRCIAGAICRPASKRHSELLTFAVRLATVSGRTARQRTSAWGCKVNPPIGPKVLDLRGRQSLYLAAAVIRPLAPLYAQLPVANCPRSVVISTVYAAVQGSTLSEVQIERA
jgi:hypothetical protein